MIESSVNGLGIGLVLGIRHAVEPDHLSAVATLFNETRSARRTALIGAIWGIGHATSIFLVALILGSLRAALPDRIALAFEAMVAAMLLVLGTASIWRAVHPPRRRTHAARASLRAPRTLMMGLVHGLAGSGLLTASVAARFPSLSMQLAFVSLFGLGALFGMAGLSGLLGHPLKLVAGRPAMERWIALGAGVVSAALGLWWAVPIAVRAGRG